MGEIESNVLDLINENVRCRRPMVERFQCGQSTEYV